jgi:transcriptional regulator with XRE-family HTH domain
MSLGTNIQIHRKRCGMTQKTVAAFLEMQLGAYQHYEYDRAEPNVASLIKLSELFGITVDELVKGVIPKKCMYKGNVKIVTIPRKLAQSMGLI